MVRILVEDFDADVNVTDLYGKTALHIVSLKGNINMVRMLVKGLGADVNARDLNDGTPLHLASEYDRRSSVQVLVEAYGADVNARDECGRTPLRLAHRCKTATRTSYVFELTCPFESKQNLENAHKRKVDKYTPLVDALKAEQKYSQVHLYCIEVGSRGYAANTCRESRGACPNCASYSLAGRRGDLKILWRV